jgi:hypothetical protein
VKILEIERENSRWLSMENLLWKKLWTCKKRELNNDDNGDNGDTFVRIYVPVSLLIVVVAICHIISSLN